MANEAYASPQYNVEKKYLELVPLSSELYEYAQYKSNIASVRTPIRYSAADPFTPGGSYNRTLTIDTVRSDCILSDYTLCYSIQGGTINNATVWYLEVNRNGITIWHKRILGATTTRADHAEGSSNIILRKGDVIVLGAAGNTTSGNTLVFGCLNTLPFI